MMFMKICAKCNKKFGFFEEKYDFTDGDGNSVKYCKPCNDEWINKEKERKEKVREDVILIKNNERKEIELKKEKQIKEFTAQLRNDSLIQGFVDQNYQKCVFSIGDWVDVSDNISQFTNEKILTKENITSKKKCIMLKGKELKGPCYGYFLEKGKEIYFCPDIYMNNIPFKINEVEEMDYKGEVFKVITEEPNNIPLVPLELIKLLYKKYGDFQIRILFILLHLLAKERMLKLTDSLCEELKSKEQIYLHIINKELEFISEDKLSDWFNEYMLSLLDNMKKRNLINFKNLTEFKKDIIEWKEERELNRFENEILNPKRHELNIKDIDAMEGFEFEKFLSKLFKQMGYKVTQTKLTGDQGADLIIEKSGLKSVVQAKRYNGKVGNGAVQEVVSSIKHYKANDGMIVTNSEFTQSAIELADSNDITLIDRAKLSKLINEYL